MTLVSTTADADLSVHNNALLKLSAVMLEIPEVRYLLHPFKWRRADCQADGR